MVTVAVRRALRTAVRGYAVATSLLRRGPDFLLVGSERAGTTALHQALVAHPDVAPLLPGAEDAGSPHYFDADEGRGARWYRSHFPIQPPFGRDRITGDAVPYLLHHQTAPARARRDAPDARVLVLLRDPVDRALSHHGDRVAHGAETLPFEEAVGAGQFPYLDRGRYAPQLRRWLEHFPPSQVLVVRCEDADAAPAAVFAHVCAFLGISSWTPPRFGPAAGTDGPGLAPTLRRRLAAGFAEANEDLARLLGTALWWGADGPTRLDRPGVLQPPTLGA